MFGRTHCPPENTKGQRRERQTARQRERGGTETQDKRQDNQRKKERKKEKKEKKERKKEKTGNETESRHLTGLGVLLSVATVSTSLSSPSVLMDAAGSVVSSKSSEYCRLLTGRAVEITSGDSDLDLRK